MKIFLTGATGFIGSHLLTALTKLDYDITILVRKKPSLNSQEQGNYKIFSYDGNPLSLDKHFSENNYDGVVHLATYYVANHTSNDIPELLDANVNFSLNILDCAANNNVKWFINTGTFFQHYNNADYSPANLYAATKQAFMTLAKYYYEQDNGINFVTLKLNDTYGPNDTRPKIFNFWQKIASTQESFDMSPGEQLINILHINDVVAGFCELISQLNNDDEGKMNGESFVLSAEDEMPLKDLASLFEKVTKLKLNINWGAREYRKREIMQPYNKGKILAGWKQKIYLEEGIKLLVNHKNAKE